MNFYYYVDCEQSNIVARFEADLQTCLITSELPSVCFFYSSCANRLVDVVDEIIMIIYFVSHLCNLHSDINTDEGKISRKPSFVYKHRKACWVHRSMTEQRQTIVGRYKA